MRRPQNTVARSRSLQGPSCAQDRLRTAGQTPPWPQWQSAQASGNAAAIRRLSAPGPLQGSILLDCTDKNYTFYKPCPRQPFLGLSVIVPFEAKYPLYFLAEYKS